MVTRSISKRYKGIVDLINLEYFPNFPSFPNFPDFHVPKSGNGRAPRGRCLSISKFWKVWKTCSCCYNAFGFTVLSLVRAKGSKGDRSAQAVQDEASLLPAAIRAGFSSAPRPQVGNAHGSPSVAATIRPPEVRRTTITRERLFWDDHMDASERAGTFPRKYRFFSRMRCALGSADISCGGLRNILSVDFLWVPKSENMFKLSRGV